MKEKQYVENLAKEVIGGKKISREEALVLYDMPLDILCENANKIRKHFCGNGFDICTIINGKSGRCSEDCKYCAQSAYNHTCIDEYPLLDSETIVAHAIKNAEGGVLRYSIVCSGKRLSDSEVDKMCDAIRQIKAKSDISVCVSFGLLSTEQFAKLKKAGAERVHNNLETSRRNFPNICSTHTFDDKIETIKNAKKAGLSVCSGGIMGLGESKEDRIDMALQLRELGIKSVPVNMLNAIKGTPFEHNKRLTDADMQKIVAVFRFILPDASIRLAGGRGIMQDKGEGCFMSGANATISGDMLTTQGITIETDMQLINRLGYVPKKCND